MHMPAMPTKAIDGTVSKDAAVLRLSLQQLASDYLNLLATKNTLLLDLEAATMRIAALEAENKKLEEATPGQREVAALKSVPAPESATK